MKRIVSLLIGLFFVLQSFAQQPVEWSFFSKKISDNQYEIHLTATIDKGWFIFSQSSSKNESSPTEIKMQSVKEIRSAKGFTEMGTLIKKKDAIQNVKKEVYENQVDFVQVVSLQGNTKTKVDGTISFVASNGVQSLPKATVAFSVQLN